MMRTHVLNRVVLIVGMFFGASSATGQVLQDSLFQQSKGTVIGGVFDSLGGWTPINWDDMIRYDLKKYYMKGRLRIDVRNFDPPNQSSQKRHHILAMFADSIGDHNHFSYHTGDSTEKSVWDLHVGKNYGDGFKLLSIAGEKSETRKEGFNWNTDSTYHFFFYWNKDTVRFFLDSTLVFQHIHLQNFTLRYIFVGRDFTHSLDYTTGYPGNQYPALRGPIYANLSVWGDSVVPEIYPNDTLQLAINLPDTGDVYSFDIDMKYDPNLLRFQSIEKNSNEPFLTLFFNDQPGLLKIGAYSSQPIQTRHEVAWVYFLPNPDTSVVRFAHIRYVRYLINADAQPPLCHSFILHPLDSLKTVAVEISEFQVAISTANTVLVTWRTETESDNYGFEIQRARLPGSYARVGFIKGAGTSASPHEYRFVDHNLKPGTYFYRIKQIDLDGHFSYSEAQTVTVGPPQFFSLSPGYPNPFHKRVHLPFVIPNALEKFPVRCDIYDTTGRRVKSLLHRRLSSGEHVISWDGSNQKGMPMPTGVYFAILKVGRRKASRKILLLR